MIIDKIFLNEKENNQIIAFSNGCNLIFSEKNGVGKTTLLRFILYGLGYDIPNTRKIKFETCSVTLHIILDSGDSAKLIRNDRKYIELIKLDGSHIFVLPESQNKLHSLLFCSENSDLLNNLLGVFYIDQEKGWTLLNRGTVIGSIHFSIEEFIRGLANIDCSELIVEENKFEKEKERYLTLLNLVKYKKEIGELQKNSQLLLDEKYDDKINEEIMNLEIKQHNLKKAIRRVDLNLSKNKGVKKFVLDMNLIIETPSGEVLNITPDNILGLNDTIDLLITKRKILAKQEKEVRNKLDKMMEEKYLRNENKLFYDGLSEIDKIDQYIRAIPLDEELLEKKIEDTKKQIKNIKKRISDKTKSNNRFANKISNYMMEYMEKLADYDPRITNNYIYTSNLKELSGATLQKRVFAFRLSYLRVFQETLHVRLPIILDSPRNKELDDKNVDLMMRILKEDFRENQLIIASIFEYPILESAKNYKKIVLGNKLIDKSLV